MATLRTAPGAMARATRSPGPEWLVPTARAVPWRPLALAVSGLAIALVVARAAGAAPVPPTLARLALALVAATALLGLDDPARDILAALPTTSARRRAHRLALLGPAALGGGAALIVTSRELALVEAPLGAAMASLAALAAGGLLSGRVAERWREDLGAAVGAGAPILMVMVVAALPSSGALGHLTHGWVDHPEGWAAVLTGAWLLVQRARPR